MINLSKEGLLRHCKRWQSDEISLDSFVFLKVRGDIPMCSSDLVLTASLSHHNSKNYIYRTCIYKPHMKLNHKVQDL